MSGRLYANRREAGRCLAAAVRGSDLNDPIILGLPRGGIPVAYELATSLAAPLDVLIVRKLGAPFQPELALGAIASGGIVVRNEELAEYLPDVDDSILDQIIAEETRELERRDRRFRGDRPYPDLHNRDVILVDDGMATGATMRAAVEAVRKRDPARIVVAVPTASVEAVRLVSRNVDRVICLDTPDPFFAVGNYYLEFAQTTDDEVRSLLRKAWEDRSAA